MQTKPRVLIYSLTYYPSIGGAEIFIREVARRLCDRYEFVLVTALGDPELPRLEYIDQVEVHRCGAGMEFSDKHLFALYGLKAGLRLHRQNPFSLVHGVMANHAGLAALFAKQFMLMFSDDPEAISIGTTFLRISAITYWAYMILYISVSALQGLKKPIYAIWIGIYRQIAAPALIFWLLAGPKSVKAA